VTVTDRGPGIPDAELERVFEMFHRLDSRDSREVYGHGLGLHMARRLMEAMGGEIHAEPGPSGEGTRFSFWLPVAEASRA
jgi:two-component system sensor histidine kinase KdpD